MFGFFNGNNFVGQWGNRPGDIFFDLTVLKTGWESAELYYYPRPVQGVYEFSKASLVVKDIDGNIIQTVAAIPYVVGGEKLKEC